MRALPRLEQFPLGARPTHRFDSLLTRETVGLIAGSACRTLRSRRQRRVATARERLAEFQHRGPHDEVLAARLARTGLYAGARRRDFGGKRRAHHPIFGAETPSFRAGRKPRPVLG